MLQRLSQRFQAYYQRQKIAGKLNLVLLLLLALVLANSLFVFFSLNVVYVSSESLTTLRGFEKQVDEIRLAQWRFRVSHERRDALAAKELMGGARRILERLPADAMVDPVQDGGESINALMDTFEIRYREYMYLYEQTAALESGLRQASEDLLASMRALQIKPETGNLAPLLASLVQSVLGARIVQQELIIGRETGLAVRMDESVKAIVSAAAQIRARASDIDTQVVAYRIGRQAQLMGSSFGKLRDYMSKSAANDESMSEAATAISEYVGRAAKRQGESIARQMLLLISSVVIASALLVLLGSLFGRRFVRDIISPLTRLVRSSRELARGDYDQDFEVSSHDEIGELAASFSDMARTVKQQIGTLRESEQQVRQRTDELEVANQSLALAKETAEALNESLEAKVLERTEELQDANRKLSELTVTDALTGLANRRRFDAAFADEWARACRIGQPLAIIMLDIDCFKLYNDQYGHPAGDDCLRNVARVLQTSARRAGDLVARYGGEEFVVVAADSDLKTALELAETMRRSVELLAMPHEVSLAATVVTVSIGVAVMVPNENLQAARLLHMADDALYRAKHEGRNRVAA